MEPSELAAVELVPPSSRFLASFKAFLELEMPLDGKEIISLMLRTGKSPLMRGRNKGKQAPTIPSEDSTIGQYKVGVKRSFLDRSANVITIGFMNTHTCKILVTRIGLLRSMVVSGFPHLTIDEGKLTDSDLIEHHQLGYACRDGPLLRKYVLAS